jgi:hypothetical protein
MRINRFRVATYMLAVVGAATFAVWAEDKDSEGDEQKISAEQVPARAMEALKKQAGGNKIESFTKMQEFDVPGIEAEWTVDGKERAAQVTADGALLLTEEAVDAKDVPQAVAKSAEKEFKGAKDISFIRKYIVMYEAEGKLNGKAHEVDIAPSGKLAEEAGGAEEKKESK